MMNNTKKVNIYPKFPIYIPNKPTIRTITRNVTKSYDEIRTCILAGADVEEILITGKLVKLNLSNYDKKNNELLVATEIAKAKAKVDAERKVKEDIKAITNEAEAVAKNEIEKIIEEKETVEIVEEEVVTEPIIEEETVKDNIVEELEEETIEEEIVENEEDEIDDDYYGL